MMEYMAEKFNTPDYWYPKDLQKRSRVREYLSWQHLGIRLPAAKMFWMKVNKTTTALSLCTAQTLVLCQQ